jgi:hypothetical protein
MNSLPVVSTLNHILIKYIRIDQMEAMTALWVLWQLNYFRDVPIIGALEKKIAGKVLDIFLPLKTSVPFSDIWYNILPMDNGIKDQLMPSCFAEFWFDMDKAAGKLSVTSSYTPVNHITIRCCQYHESTALEQLSHHWQLLHRILLCQGSWALSIHMY